MAVAVPSLSFSRRRSTKTTSGIFSVKTERCASLISKLLNLVERSSQDSEWTTERSISWRSPHWYYEKPLRRCHSIGTARIGSTKDEYRMASSIDIQVNVRDLAIREPACSLYICSLWDNEGENESQWRLIGRSEATGLTKRNLHFDHKFSYSYVFEKAQLIRVDISRHHDGCNASPSDDVMGSCIFKVDELIGSFGLQLRKPLHRTCTIAATLANPRHLTHSLGGVAISGQMPEKEQPIVVQLHGKGLERKDFLWDETAVFFRVYRLEEGELDDSRVLLYESEAIRNHSHPQWAEFRLCTRDAADNRNRLLEVWVLYRDVDGTEGSIGKFLTTYAKMKYGVGPDNVYHIINETKKQQKKSYEHSGKMEMVKFTDVSFYSFLDYIVSGTQLHFELAVDFSNPEGSSATTDQKKFDADLQLALRAIGGILKDYSPNRLFRAFGVGAKVPPTFHESHEFHMNLAVDPFCRGLDGVVEAYRRAQSTVIPTKEIQLAPVVNYATRLSHGSGFRGLHYHVLAIFIRSPPTDLKDLQAALSTVSDAPLSILFVGIGPADFSSLHKIAMKRKENRRDCVEFIGLSELLDSSEPPAVNKARVAEQVLHNVPLHMTSFMHNNNIAPKPPIQVCRSPLFHSSSLIPDHPTVFPFDDISPSDEPQTSRPSSDRRGSDSHFLEVDGLRNSLTVRVPERCHSVLQTSKEQYQRRLNERGLGKMRFPRVELSTLESSGSTQDSII